MTYKQYLFIRQSEYEALPIFYAFNNEQLEKAMNERGLLSNETEKIFRLGDTGGFYLRTDSDKINNYFNKEDELSELMKDHAFAIEAFLYELWNHEYIYNDYQGDWDVCSCFGHCEYSELKDYKDYLQEMGYDDDTVRAYKDAKREYYKYCDEHDIC